MYNKGSNAILMEKRESLQPMMLQWLYNLYGEKKYPDSTSPKKIMQDGSFWTEISICLQMKGKERVGGRDPKGAWGNLGGDGYVHYLDCGDDFTCIYIYQNLLNFILYTCSLLYINCISKKLLVRKR